MSCAICKDFKGNTERESQFLAQHEAKFTLEDLRLSAKSCPCCCILQSGSRGCFSQHGIDESTVLSVELKFYYPYADEDLHTDHADKYLSFSLIDSQWFYVEFFASQDNRCPIPKSWDCIPTKPRTSQQTDSVRAFVALKSWIARCIVSHYHPKGHCDQQERPELPTRVVDVGLTDGIVKLVEPKGKRGRYICLSHCWGLVQIATTTKSTFEERKRGIAWGELSKTFQDAIMLTRKLGFDYIWIDSLCIIQDDGRDWGIESAKMASVYSNGFLTIAATHSPNGQGGLFGSTRDFELRGKTTHGEDYRLYFREQIDHQMRMDKYAAWGTTYPRMNPTASYFPLLTRAWVFQERMLSTRVLHFGRNEMFFECRSSIECECGDPYGNYDGSLIKMEYADAIAEHIDGEPDQACEEPDQADEEPDQAYEEPDQEYEDSDQVDEDSDQADEETYYKLARIWRTMVSCYTPLLLTKSKDRLPAISGLANQMAPLRDSRCLAGLWERDLNEDLLWIVSTGKERPRPYPLNAPTWSWASVESPVYYSDATNYGKWREGIDEYPPREHFSVVESCESCWSIVDGFGPSAQGSLRISGLVAQGTLEQQMGPREKTASTEYYVSTAKARSRMRPDYLLDHEGPGQTNPLTSVLCLRMSLVTKGYDDMLVSLVLRKSPRDHNSFERIGVLLDSDESYNADPIGDLFDSADIQTVIIH
ncbi:uncharacterized protein N0V89_010014 [Didymosphaeria variabile]|uniref:Heterokaryon incompatibility domain-containing protein n=1 Tax=Didymosphaeria variabile TaxID=1932322 RepID=A0A9W8XG70_9PLEO|nr:uncharacterized protein N0V89_010014 [Didymosphaeria variabile]KAJ4348636.1 hypothetical protein N0V89_010014 [Didymosphaeria variabile]